MKICITAKGDKLDSQFDERFARAEYFIFYDTDTGKFEGIENPLKDGEHGVGIKASQFIADRGVEAVLSGNFGPKASDTLSSLGVKTIKATGSTVKEIIDNYKDKI